MHRILFALVPLVGLSVSGFADPACIAANFVSIDGTSCTIGSLDFTFTGTESYGGGWGASSVYFTPIAKGFTLSFLGGPQSVTESFPYPYEYNVFDQLDVKFTVTGLGDYLAGATVTGGAFSASGISAFASDGYLILDGPSVGSAGSAISCGSEAVPHCTPLDLTTPLTSPLSATDTGYAGVFDLYAGNGTATWDGSPTAFSFAVDDNVPEPGTWVLLSLGILFLVSTYRIGTGLRKEGFHQESW